MATLKYRVQRGKVTVKARSSVHDTSTVWSKPSGTIVLDPEQPEGAIAEIALDMRAFDAGDFLKNWKLKSEIEPDQHPTATFHLGRLENAHEQVAGRFTAVAVGQIEWRGRRAEVRARGEASVDRRAIDARAQFELNVRDLGVSPPRFLVFKVEDVVTVQVELFALA